MSFRVRTSQYNTVDLQDLGASLSQFIINSNSQTQTTILTPTQLYSVGTGTNAIQILPAPGPNKYNIIRYITTELEFITGGVAYAYGGLPPTYTYDQYGENSAGVTIDQTSIVNSIACIGYKVSTGFGEPQTPANIVNAPIYLTASAPYTNGTSNVKLTINYATNNYP